MKNKNKKNIFVLFVFLFFVFAPKVLAYMESGNYRMQKDSINMGGTENSSSTNYVVSDTLGEIGTGESSSTNYVVNAGYRQMDQTYLSITTPDDIYLSPEISGLNGGEADGSGTWNVKTDNSAGYVLYIKSDTDPAMKFGSVDFADYTPASSTTTPDYDWNLGSADAEFGFSPYNAESQADKYRNNGSACNVGSSVVSQKCWNSLATSDEAVVDRSSRTDPSGEDTVFNFKAEITEGSNQRAGTYTATVVVTAMAK